MIPTLVWVLWWKNFFTFHLRNSFLGDLTEITAFAYFDDYLNMFGMVAF